MVGLQLELQRILGWHKYWLADGISHDNLLELKGWVLLLRRHPLLNVLLLLLLLACGRMLQDHLPRGR